jgi:hypothetical protein
MREFAFRNLLCNTIILCTLLDRIPWQPAESTLGLDAGVTPKPLNRKHCSTPSKNKPQTVTLDQLYLPFVSIRSDLLPAVCTYWREALCIGAWWPLGSSQSQYPSRWWKLQGLWQHCSTMPLFTLVVGWPPDGPFPGLFSSHALSIRKPFNSERVRHTDRSIE